MKWTQKPLGPVQANAYVIYHATGDCLIMDPGGEADDLITFVNHHQLQPMAVILTHAHFDHIGAVDIIRDYWDIPVYLHANEKDWLSDSRKNGSAYFPMVVDDCLIRPADDWLPDRGLWTLGDFSFEMLWTPGHSPGSVSFYQREEGIVFAVIHCLPEVSDEQTYMVVIRGHYSKVSKISYWHYRMRQSLHRDMGRHLRLVMRKLPISFFHHKQNKSRTDLVMKSSRAAFIENGK